MDQPKYFLAILVCLTVQAIAAAETPAVIPPPLTTLPPPTAAVDAPEKMSPNQAAKMQETIAALLLPFIPHEYKNEKQWGGTTQVFDGLKLEREGLKLETRRRWKTVNHGTWTRYEMNLVDPKRDLQLSAANYAETDQGMKFDLLCDAKLHITGRMSQWNRGVQLISLGMEADATVRLRIGCLLSLQLDAAKFPPDVLLRPVITDAHLEMTSFRLRRVSELHGPFVKQLGVGVREILEDKIAEQDDKLVEKLNRSLEKKKDQLRFSMQDLVKSPWGDLSRFAQPPSVTKLESPPSTPTNSPSPE